MAEYRELPMVLASLRRSFESPNWDESRIPKKFRLNAGHVTFFYNKKRFLRLRYNSLIAELRRRGYKIQPDAREVDFTVYRGVRTILWKPDEDDVLLSLERIIDRHKMKPEFYRFNGKPMSVEKYKVLALKYINRGMN